MRAALVSVLLLQPPPLVSSVPAPPTLLYAACNTSDGAQRFSLSQGTVRQGSLCATYAGGSYDAPLQLQPCASPPAAAQSWVLSGSGALVNAAGSCAGAGGTCLEWSGQETAACTSTPPALGPLCRVGVWQTSSPTTWNDAFLADSPAPGMLQAAATGAAAASGLCVAAVAPPPPARPTARILEWAAAPMGCLYDIDLSIYSATPQGCACGAPPPPAAAWAPAALDAGSWLDAGLAAGCERHILVAKHMCGFLSWASTSVPGYNFSTAYSPTPVDAVAAFVAAARARRAPVGMYYSLTNNARTNTCAGQILPNPGANQIAVTPAQYDALVVAQLTELWGDYGPLDEIWFDGGFTPSLQTLLPPLIARLQPTAVAFQGERLSANPTRWVGTESGAAPYDTWSTSDLDSYGAGDPDACCWFPAETDFTVLANDAWFFQEGAAVRSDAVLRGMYEASVGRNTVALLGVGIPPNGTMAGTEQAAAMARLGAYVSGCYGGAPLAALVNASGAALTLPLPGGAGALVDRVVVDEDQREGQRVRGWRLDFQLVNGSSVPAAAGASIGNRRIAVVPPALAQLPVAAVTLTITNATALPAFRRVALLGGCDELARRIDAAAAAAAAAAA